MSRSFRVSSGDLDAIAKSKTVEHVLLHIAEVGARGSARRAPVKSGTLRDSYAAESQPGEARFGTNVSYAIDVELGTFSQPAQPHVRPAIDDCKSLGDVHV